jgi:hypothetical protein
MVQMKSLYGNKSLDTPLSGLGFLLSRSNGLRWNAVFDAPRRVVTRISSAIKLNVSVCWTHEHPELHSHAERGNEISQKSTPARGQWGVKSCPSLQAFKTILSTFLTLVFFNLTPSALAQEIQTDSTVAYISIKSSSPGYEAYLDGHFIGQTPIRLHAVPEGEHTVLLRRTTTNSWMMTDWTKTFLVEKGDTLELFARLKRPYLVKSQPFGAEVFLDGQFQGTTPLIIELADTIAYSLTLIKEGYRPANVICDPAASQFIFTTLQPDPVYSSQQKQIYELAQLRKGKNKRQALIFTGLTLASGVAAILLNNKADNLYEQYLQAGDPETRERFFERTGTYDTYTGIVMGLFQVNLGLSFYFFYKSQK